MFIDRAKVTLKGGDGGDGLSAFRRERFIPKGGPNGGDGGRGGTVYLRGNSRLRTLLDFVRKPKYAAERGKDGMTNNSFGRDGVDLVLDVPLGTTLYKNGEVFVDILKEGQLVLVAKGGRGGRGNVHFKSSTRQTPRISERGEPAQVLDLEMRLRLIADVGFVGFPNAGKSTLLSRLTRAHPKIANYPFTTLFPNLGVSYYHDREIIFADMPGLIEGSHTGKGLGHQFLQHLERTRLLVHVVDPFGYENFLPREGIRVINREMKSFSKVLGVKPQIMAVNKMDLTGAHEVYSSLKKSLRNIKVFAISGVTGEGIPELLKEVDRELKHIPMAPVEKLEEAKPKRLRIQLEPDFWVERSGGHLFVRGNRVEKLIMMTPFHLPEAVERTQHILKKMGVERALLKYGAKRGDQIKIADREFTFEPDITEGARRHPRTF